MLKDSSRKEWQYLIVYKLDRFSRNKFESVIHKKTLRDNGVTILSAMENLTDSPEGRMMETVWEGNDDAKHFYAQMGMLPKETQMEFILRTFFYARSKRPISALFFSFCY